MEASRTSAPGSATDDDRGAVPAAPSDAADGGALDRLAELALRLLNARSARITAQEGGVLGAAGTGGADPQAPIDLTVTTLCVPVAAGDGSVVGAVSVSDRAGRLWSPEDEAALGHLTPAVLAALQVRALNADLRTERLRWQLAMEASGMGSFDADLVAGRLHWDEGMFALMGVDPTHFTGSSEEFYSRLHPDDRAGVRAQIDAATAACGTYVAQGRIIRPDGQVRWFSTRGRVLADADGAPSHLVGAVLDTTETRAGDERVARALDTVAVAFLTADGEGVLQYVNGVAERLLGFSRAELLGRRLVDALPAAALPPFVGAFADAAAHRRPVVFEAPITPATSAPTTWCEVRASPSVDGLTLTLLDISAVRAARLRSARMAERTALLARVTAELAETLDAGTAVTRLARLVVPALADACLVAVGADDGSVEDVGSWHRDTRARARLTGAARSVAAALMRDPALAQARRMSAPAFVTPAQLAAIGPAGSVLAPGCSALVLPLRARGRGLGVMVLLRQTEGGEQDRDEVAIAQEIALRAALSLDNARLYKIQRDLAEGLQRRMLTEPPALPDVVTAVRYLPASLTAQVGGDWYDAFVQPPGLPVLVIGDVVGHDTAAAALMGQLRALLRGIAHTTGEGPARVLTRLDAALEGLRVRTTATAAVVRVEDSRHDGGVRSGAVLRWANAGHPPPMVVSADGSVRLLTLDEPPATVPDLLLGVDARSARHERLVPFEESATLLLYTDGLVERRDLPVQRGIERLAEQLSRLAQAPLDELCDELLARLVPGTREDDVALLALRLAP